MQNFLTQDCLKFLNALHKNFEQERKNLLERREYKKNQRKTLQSWPISDFHNDWKCKVVPTDLQKRTVEITGPATPTKMVINALNSGADGYMADFEDSLSPTWENILCGHKNLIHFSKNMLCKTINNKTYSVNKNHAVLHVRPRGLHLTEDNLLGMSASLFDFGVNFFHTVYHHQTQETQPYYYIPKLEYHEEARWWATVFKFSEEYMKVPISTIRCTVLIETLPAIFNIEQIIYQLRDYITGLNAGRWDYIFSNIKTRPSVVLPNRSNIDMKQFCMEAYSRIIVNICHKHNIKAIGGMAAQTPIKNNEEKNKLAFEKVTQDKILEVSRGFDGTWVSHPAFVKTAREAFNIKIADFLQHKKENMTITSSAFKFLLEKPTGPISEEELSNNVSVGIEYLTNWLQGNGCVSINNLMEDLATAEIARAQTWQWIKHKIFPVFVVNEKINLAQKRLTTKENKKYVDVAIKIFKDLVLKPQCEEFLTTDAYKTLLELTNT